LTEWEGWMENIWLEVMVCPPWEGYFLKIWVGVCSTLLETLTLFQTKRCDFPYPILDLTQNLITYFRPDPNPISFAYTFEKGLKFPMLIKPQFFGEEIDTKTASCKNHTRSHIRVHKPHPISDQNGQNLYPISDQKGSKTIPFWCHTYLYSLYKGVPLPGWCADKRSDICMP